LFLPNTFLIKPGFSLLGSLAQHLSDSEFTQHKLQGHFLARSATQTHILWQTLRVGSKRIIPEQAVALMLNAGVQPLTPFETNRTPWRSTCLTCDREVRPTYSNVRLGHGACKYCAGLSIPASAAVETMLKALARPLEQYPGAKKPCKCECLLCGREIQPTLSVSKSTALACNFCKRTRIDARDAEITMRSNDLAPRVPYKSVHTRWESECLRCGSIIFPTLQKVRIRGHQCAWCAGKIIPPKDAAETMLSAGVRPQEAYPGANNPWKCECLTCGRNVTPNLSYVSVGGSPCKWCAGKSVDPSEAKVLMRAHGVEPIDAYPGSVKPWRCKCLTCLREVSPAYGNVLNGHSPCAYCSGKKVDPETATEVALSRRLEPLEKYPGSVIPWRLKCLKCGLETESTWTAINVKRVGSGCSSCTPYGFKLNLESFFYIIEHPKKLALKIGISNLGSGRLTKHSKNGWTIGHLLKFSTGREAKALESAMLHQLRRVERLPPAFLTGDGWTETVPSVGKSMGKLIELAKSLSSAALEEVSPVELSRRD